MKKINNERLKANYMSWDFKLCNPVTKEVLHTQEKHEISGGTYCVGGTTEMSLNITYNYSNIINKKMAKLKIGKSDEYFTDKDNYSYADYFNGKTGAETIEPLNQIIASLKNDVHINYWKATEGNAKRALYGLLAFARLRPDGIWKVS